MDKNPPKDVEFIVNSSSVRPKGRPRKDTIYLAPKLNTGNNYKKKEVPYYNIDEEGVLIYDGSVRPRGRPRMNVIYVPPKLNIGINYTKKPKSEWGPVGRPKLPPDVKGKYIKVKRS